jgi:hypothetical protein
MMGTWGAGNFDSDDACEFMDETLRKFHKIIEDCLLPENFESFFLEAFGEYTLMPAIDVIITLCEHYDISPQLEVEKIKGWKELYLRVYDETVDTFGPKADWKINRRKVIEVTFNKLEALAKEWE